MSSTVQISTSVAEVNFNLYGNVPSQTDASPRAKKNFLIRARAHAYESAGSYAMEGMVRDIRNRSWRGRYRDV